jgi:Uma2 family endonuclease
MPPTGSRTGIRNADLTYQLLAWAEKDRSGVTFDSSSGFTQEYISNGALMAWLIDPVKRRFYIYKPDQGVNVLENPDVVSDASLLPGFELSMLQLW